MASEVLLEQKESVATITLNRPLKGNTIDDSTMDLLIAALREAGERQETRILLLRGAGENFCKGREGHSTAAGKVTAMDIRDSLKKITIVNALLDALTPITIAVVQGRALGFGAGLAVRADITIAADNARFGFPEIKGSIPPTVVMSYLSRWIPRKKALEMVITGAEIDALEAERLGMINRIVPFLGLEQEVSRWISCLMEMNATALRTCKQFLVDAEQMAPSEASTYGVHVLATLLASR
jgi:enoyl-CoA hydratase/carnithine racemase